MPEEKALLVHVRILLADLLAPQAKALVHRAGEPLVLHNEALILDAVALFSLLVLVSVFGHEEVHQDPHTSSEILDQEVSLASVLMEAGALARASARSL